MSFKIRVLKTLDRAIGSFAVHLFRPNPGSTVRSPTSFLLIRPGGIGDAVLLLPVIQHLRRAYPSSQITVLAEKRNAAIFRLCEGIDTIYTYDRPIDLSRVFQHTYDIVIDTEQWHRLSALIARLQCSPMTIGFSTNNRKRLFSHPVSYHHDEYEPESFFRLIGTFMQTASLQVSTPYLRIPAEVARRAEFLLGPLYDQPFVVIFPGSSIPEKRWGTDKFKEVASAIGRHGIPVVVVGDRSEFAHGEIIVDGVSGINLSGKTTLAEVAAVIARSRFLVSGDSGILHMGVALGVPTVSLFGPSNAEKWHRAGDRHVLVRKNLACSPCSRFGYTPKCSFDHRCMADISVADVVATIENLLGMLRRQEMEEKNLDITGPPC